MEAVLEDDDAGASGRRARDLDRILDRLGARVHEDRLLALAGAGRVLCEPAAHLDVGLVRADHEALVEELVDLLVDRRDDRREPVPRVLARDPAREVEVDRAVRGLDLRALGAHDHEPGSRDASRDVALPRLEDVVDRRALPERHAAILPARAAARNGRPGDGFRPPFDKMAQTRVRTAMRIPPECLLSAVSKE